MGQTIPTGLSSMQYECPASCTSQMSGPITVVSSQLHMHQVGVSMHTETVRDGQIVTEGNAGPRRAEYYDFNFQDSIWKTFQVLPGDTLRTTCTYRVNEAGGPVRFGLASQDEMCIDFVSYYPSDPFLEKNRNRCGGNGRCGGKLKKPLQRIEKAELDKYITWPGVSKLQLSDCSAENTWSPSGNAGGSSGVGDNPAGGDDQASANQHIVTTASGVSRWLADMTYDDVTVPFGTTITFK